MAGNDVYLYGVPSDADADDVRLRDPSAPAVSTVTGAFAVTLAGLSLAATGAVAVKADAALTLDGLTLAATGTVAAAGVTGEAAITLDGLTVSARAETVDLLRPRRFGAMPAAAEAKEERLELTEPVKAVIEAAFASVEGKPDPEPEVARIVRRELKLDGINATLSEIERLLSAYGRLQEIIEDEETAILFLLAA